MSWQIIRRAAPAVLVLCGCFAERSLPMQTGDVRRIRSELPSARERGSTRAWLRWMQPQLADLLPRDRVRPLLTEDFTTADGQPFEVYPYFERDPVLMNNIFANFTGLLHSANGSSFGDAHMKPVAPWPGFEEVEIPVGRDFRLSGRLGLARDGQTVRRADCIIVLPGLFGDNGVLRSVEAAQALRKCGYHVLSVELRAHGRTEVNYPDTSYSFGPLEIDDLMAVSDWLEARPEVRATGLMGYCWSANLGLLAAWRDGSDLDHPSITPAFRPFLRAPDGRRRFRAGVLVFSPALRFEEVIEALETRRYIHIDPGLNCVQEIVNRRVEYRQYPGINGSLRRLIETEVGRTMIQYPEGVDDGLHFLRLLPHRGMADGDKLEWARVPVLIVHASNDPLAPAQYVAELMAQTENPLVAAVMPRGGGHVGFAAYAREYYYSLMMNFFDPEHGAAAWNREP